MSRSLAMQIELEARLSGDERRRRLLAEVLSTLRLAENREHLDPRLRELAECWWSQFESIEAEGRKALDIIGVLHAASAEGYLRLRHSSILLHPTGKGGKP